MALFRLVFSQRFLLFCLLHCFSGQSLRPPPRRRVLLTSCLKRRHVLLLLPARHLSEPFRHRHLSFDAWKSACQSTRPRGTAAVLLVVVVLRLTLQAFLLPLKFSQHRPFLKPR